MASHYWYVYEGKVLGPVTSKALRDLAADGRLGANDLICKEGSEQWVEVRRVKGLVPEAVEGKRVAGPPPLPVPPSLPTPAVVPPPLPAVRPPSREPELKGVRRGLNEIKEAVNATAAQTRRVVQAGQDKLAERRLRGEADAAQAELGEQLFRAGLGEPGPRAKLTAVNEEILRLVAAKASTRAAGQERLDLQRRLAEPYLKQPVPAEIGAAQGKALAAQEALQQHARTSAQARANLLPGDRLTGIRVAAVAGAAGLATGLVVVILLCVTFWPRGKPSSPRPEGQAARAGEGDAVAPWVEPQGNGGEVQVPAQDGQGSPAKRRAYQDMAEAEAAFKQANAAYEADHQRYRQARDTALAQAGRRGAMGLAPAKVTPADPRLYQEMLRAQQAYHRAKKAFEETE